MDFDRNLNELIDTLVEENHVLSERVYEQVKRLFLANYHRSLWERVPEYHKAEKGNTEFFSNVDIEGSAHYPSEALIEDFRNTVNRNPIFGLWFSETRCPGGNGNVLLVARWLAHLVGLRHRSAHVFLDHPRFDNTTLIQIRGYDKADSPGFFDIPVGEHSQACENLSETYERGLSEELGLRLDDIEDATLINIGNYEYAETPKRKYFHNIEHRAVFWGRVAESSMPKITFSDEVAGICMLPIPGLSNLLKTDRVASGLVGSFNIYLRHRIQKQEPKFSDLIATMKGSRFNFTLLDIFQACLSGSTNK